MRKRVISFVLVVCMLLAIVPAVVTDGLSSSYSIDTFVGIAGVVADYIDTVGEFPARVVYNGYAYNIEKDSFYGLALACIKSLYDGVTTGNITRVPGYITSNITGYTDSFNHVSVNKDFYMNTVTRNITWALSSSSLDAGSHYYGAYVTYPSSNYPAYNNYTGNFSFTRCLCTYARVLRHYRDYNVLPDNVDCTDLRTQIFDDGIYKIKNMSGSSKALKMSTVTEPCEVTVETDTDSSEQHWMFVKQSDGWYKIYTLHNWASQGRKLLKLSSLNTEASVMSEGTQSDNFLFKIYSPTPGYYWLMSKASQLDNCVMQYNSASNTVTSNTVAWTSGIQRWTINPVSNSLTDGTAYNISSAYSGDYIGIKMSDMTSGANPAELEMFYDPDSCSQQWKLTKQSNGWYTFSSAYSGYSSNHYLRLNSQGILEIATLTTVLSNADNYLFMPYKLPNAIGKYNIICKSDVDANLSLKLYNEGGENQYKIVHSTPYGDTGYEKWYIEAVTPVTGIALSSAEEMLEIGDTLSLTATVSPTNASIADVTWSSADTSIATVTQQGVVTGISTGTTSIRVTSNADPNIYQDCSVRVGNYFATVKCYYDKGFNARYSDNVESAEDKIRNDLLDVVADQFATKFNINIKVENVDMYTSTSDACMESRGITVNWEAINGVTTDQCECTTSPTSSCNYWTRSSGVFYYDNPLNIDFVPYTTFYTLFLGHNLFDKESQPKNNSYTYNIKLISGQDEPYIPIVVIEKLRSSCEELYLSLLHEFSHQFGAPDHYHDGKDGERCKRYPICSGCGDDPSLTRPEGCLMQTTVDSNLASYIWCDACEEDIETKLEGYFKLSQQ